MTLSAITKKLEFLPSLTWKTPHKSKKKNSWRTTGSVWLSKSGQRLFQTNKKLLHALQLVTMSKTMNFRHQFIFFPKHRWMKTAKGHVTHHKAFMTSDSSSNSYNQKMYLPGLHLVILSKDMTIPWRFIFSDKTMPRKKNKGSLDRPKLHSTWKFRVGQRKNETKKFLHDLLVMTNS